MHLYSSVLADEALAAAMPDPRREISVDISAPASAEVLRRLGEVADRTAFTLTGVTPLDGGWRCHFALSAHAGVIGDRQVFALLSAIGRHWRWMSVHRATAESVTVEMPVMLAAE